MTARAASGRALPPPKLDADGPSHAKANARQMRRRTRKLFGENFPKTLFNTLGWYRAKIVKSNVQYNVIFADVRTVPREAPTLWLESF